METTKAKRNLIILLTVYGVLIAAVAAVWIYNFIWITAAIKGI